MHNEISDEQTSFASFLDQYGLLDSHFEAIAAELSETILHLQGELQSVLLDKEMNEKRMEEVLRQLKILDLSRKKLEAEFEYEKLAERLKSSK